MTVKPQDQNLIVSGYPRLDIAAAIIACLTLSVAVLYPETFITSMPLLGSKAYSPLTILSPLMAIGVTVYLFMYRKDLNPGAVDILVLIFGGYLLARNMFQPSNLMTSKYLVFALGMYYITTLLAARGEKLLRILIYTLLALMTVTAIYGLIEYAVQDNFIYHDYIAGIVRDPTVGLHRIGSTLAHPVPYGAFLLQALPFSILVWIGSRDKRQRYMGMSVTLLAVLAFFFTFSKGSWIVAIILAGAALLFYRGGRSRRIFLPALVIILVIVFTTVVSWQQVRFETETRAEDSVDARLVGWKAAIDGIIENPVVGVGLRQGEQELKKHIDPEWYELADRAVPVDNYYLSLVLEAGFIGLAIWMAMFVMILVEGMRVVRRRRSGWQWALAAMVSIIGISLNAVTFEAMHIWSNFVVFWMAAGIIHGIGWRPMNPLPHPKPGLYIE